jgi:hypothetical protein
MLMFHLPRILSVSILFSVYGFNPIHKISGFYGLIGPNINKSKVKSLFELFTGDGIIQGVFMNPGNISFVKHLIQTDKIIHESKYGPFRKNPIFLPFYMFAYKMNVLPNIMGIANTALLKINKKWFALFERDYPYEIQIQPETREIHTLRKLKVPFLKTFSGHSKYDGKHIHSIDYNVLLKRVRYLQFNSSFAPSILRDIPMRYIPIVHDFVVLKNGVLITDSPIQWNIFNRAAVSLSHKPTYIHIYNWTTQETTIYTIPESLYLFHYANVLEHTNGTIELYGIFYESLDFSSLNISGKYRKIVVDPFLKHISMSSLKEFENLNVDFPKKWGSYTILQRNENNRFSGFIVSDKERIIQRVILPVNRSFCGEPEIVHIENSDYLLGISYDRADNGYVSLCGLSRTEYFEIPLNTTVSIGFHSTFINYSLSH